jgi:hypothetical protein
VADTTAVIGAVARFLQAWRAATQGDTPLHLSDPLVIEAHEAALRLIQVTESTNLVGAYGVVDDLVSENGLIPRRQAPWAGLP